MKVCRRGRRGRHASTDELGSGESLGADGGEMVEKLRQTKTKKQNARETEEGGASEGVCWEGGKKEGLGGGNEVTESERREGKKKNSGGGGDLQPR